MHGGTERWTDDALSIGDVSRVLGVPASTIRSWERRFRYPAPGRSVGGHRRYTRRDVRALAIVRDEIARGRGVGEAVVHASDALASQRSAASAYVDRIVRAAIDSDPPAIAEALATAERTLGREVAVAEVAIGGLRGIGWSWEIGACDVAQEHAGSGEIRRWLRSKRVGLELDPGPTVILAAGPTDEHTGGLEALATLLAMRRVPALVVAGVAETALMGAVATHGTTVVVLASHMAVNRETAVRALKALRGKVRCFYGGAAFLRARARSGVPGVYLGEDLRAAAATVTDAWRATIREQDRSRP